MHILWPETDNSRKETYTHNTCFYKEVDKKYTDCNLKTMELLECALIGVCAVIRLNTTDIRNKVIVCTLNIVNPNSTPYSS